MGKKVRQILLLAIYCWEDQYKKLKWVEKAVSMANIGTGQNPDAERPPGKMTFRESISNSV